LFLDHQVEDKETIGTHNSGRKRVEGREASSKIIILTDMVPCVELVLQ
jgi:hypothetical protein